MECMRKYFEFITDEMNAEVIKFEYSFLRFKWGLFQGHPSQSHTPNSHNSVLFYACNNMIGQIMSLQLSSLYKPIWVLFIVAHTLLDQSCPRVTFFEPDPTRRNVDPTRPAIADKKSDPTRPAARPFPNMYNYWIIIFINLLIIIYWI